MLHYADAEALLGIYLLEHSPLMNVSVYLTKIAIIVWLRVMVDQNAEILQEQSIMNFLEDGKIGFIRQVVMIPLYKDHLAV